MIHYSSDIHYAGINGHYNGPDMISKSVNNPANADGPGIDIQGVRMTDGEYQVDLLCQTGLTECILIEVN